MSDEVDWDNGEPINLSDFRLTGNGVKTALAVVSEFCHGFTIEEIANNIPEFNGDADMVKGMMMMICQQAGLINVEI